MVFSYFTYLDFQITLECRNLHRLSVAGCPRLSDGPLITLFRQNPNLAHVDLRGCCSLSGGALQVRFCICDVAVFPCVFCTSGGGGGGCSLCSSPSHLSGERNWQNTENVHIYLTNIF